MKPAALAIIILCCLYACNESGNLPSSVLPADEIGTILFEITMAEEFVNTYVTKDSSKHREAEIKKEYQKIFLMHGITEKQFIESYDFYRTHTDMYKNMMDSLNARAQRKRSEIYHTPGP